MKRKPKHYTETEFALHTTFELFELVQSCTAYRAASLTAHAAEKFFPPLLKNAFLPNAEGTGALLAISFDRVLPQCEHSGFGSMNVPECIPN